MNNDHSNLIFPEDAGTYVRQPDGSLKKESELKSAEPAVVAEEPAEAVNEVAADSPAKDSLLPWAKK